MAERHRKSWSNSKLEGRLKAYTEFTLTDIKDLHSELAIIRKRGYAECVEEIERGMCSVAAPVGRSELGKTLSIGATGSARVFSRSYRRQIGKQLCHLGDELAECFGWDLTENTSKSVTNNG